jgi:hypothetical protein
MGAAQDSHTSQLDPQLVAVLRKICKDASECEMHGEPSTVDGIDWEDIVQARELLAKLGNTTPQPDSPATAQIDDGGPAYPEHFYFDPGKGMYGQYVSASCVGFGGMSLRDHFAGQALQGVIASRIPLENNTAANPQMYASAAYAIADAMLAARKGGGK